jgi:long-chain acyl-CoA synthetase
MIEHHREGRTGLIQPLGYEGVQRRHDGILCYADRPESLVEMLRASAERFPRKNAIVEVGGQTLTYAELWERAASIAGGLRRSGVTPGDRVAVRYGNGIRWCLAFFGSLLAGAVVVPVNTRLAEREAQYILEDADVSYVFEGVRDLPCGHPFAHEAARSDIAALFYTSGTTGFPKGAITTHENFLATSETFQRQAGRPDPGIRHLISIPLFHVTGCNSQLIPTLEMGGTSIVLRTFSTEAFISAVREFRVDFLVSVPSVYWLVMEHPEFHSFDRSTVRFLACGGAPTPPALISKIAKAFPQARLVNGYGLTETAATSTSLPHEYIQSRPDSVGLAIPIVELDLADVDAMSGIGELLIRGQNVTSGYWRNSLATDAAFVNGWFHTGDLARIDTDGFVT